MRRGCASFFAARPSRRISRTGSFSCDSPAPAEDRKLAERVETFRRQTRTRKGVRVVMITSFGLKRNKYSGNVQSVITLEDLFR